MSNLNFDVTNCAMTEMDEAVTAVMGDEMAHTFTFTMADNGEIAADTVECRFLRPDMTTVYWESAFEETDGRLSLIVTLPSECYAVPGSGVFSVKAGLTSGGKRTIFRQEFAIVQLTSSTGIVSDERKIPGILEAGQIALEARELCHRWENPTAEAVTVSPNEAAAVTLEGSAFTFRIPKGEKGDTGDVPAGLAAVQNQLSNLGTVVMGTAVTSTVTSAWTTNMTMTLSVGTWLIGFGGSVGDTDKSVTLRVTGAGMEMRQSIVSPDINMYSGSGFTYAAVENQSVIQLQSWSVNVTNLNMEMLRLFAIRLK